MLGVPTVFVSGDEGLMEEVRADQCPYRNLRGQARRRPVDRIDDARSRRRGNPRRRAEAALKGNLKQPASRCRKHCTLEITYNDPVTAYRMCWYPGAGHAGDRTIRFETANYLDILRMLNFVT